MYTMRIWLAGVPAPIVIECETEPIVVPPAVDDHGHVTAPPRIDYTPVPGGERVAYLEFRAIAAVMIEARGETESDPVDQVLADLPPHAGRDG